MIGFRFIFTVFVVTILLVLSVYIRTSTDGMCYETAAAQIKENRLRQQLRQKQLQHESYISPATLSKGVLPSDE